MSHMLAPQPPNPELHLFFNVDAAVGAAPAENKKEDVLLVQFAFKVIADSPRPTTDKGLLAAAKAVRVTGTIDDATINAIRVEQRLMKEENSGQIVDGRVSSARNAYNYGTGLWVITVLNHAIATRIPNTWPRIDKIAGCPIELQQMVVRAVVGVRRQS